MAQSKPEKSDLIDRTELLRVITDHTAKLGGTASLQVAMLSWFKALVQAMPAKAVLVDLVCCEDCKHWEQTAVLGNTNPIGICNIDADGYRLAHEYCSDGIRRADHGG